MKAPVVKKVSVEKTDVTEFNRIFRNYRRVASVSIANESVALRTSNWLCVLKAWHLLQQLIIITEFIESYLDADDLTFQLYHRTDKEIIRPKRRLNS